MKFVRKATIIGYGPELLKEILRDYELSQGKSEIPNPSEIFITPDSESEDCEQFVGEIIVVYGEDDDMELDR